VFTTGEVNGTSTATTSDPSYEGIEETLVQARQELTGILGKVEGERYPQSNVRRTQVTRTTETKTPSSSRFAQKRADNIDDGGQKGAKEQKKPATKVNDKKDLEGTVVVEEPRSWWDKVLGVFF
jgi:hypothetical protein